MRTRKILVSAIVMSFGLAGTAAHADPKDEAAAVKAADVWLKLLDGKKFDKSWDQASTAIQKAVTKADWVQKMTAASNALGKVLSRKVASKSFHTSLPGAPKGKYVVITYKTSFEKKKDAAELVTPMLEGGAWKVSGYFIK